MKGKGIVITDDYDLQISVQRDATGKIISGLVIGNTLYQNQALILIAQPGEIKSSPIVGVGAENMINDQDFLGWRRTIQLQMELDGQSVKKVVFGKNQNLEIDAKYGNG